jgi:hypothetical protein
MASVIRLSHGGGTTVEESGLTVEQAHGAAARLSAAGEPGGCCWCVGVWDEEEAYAKETADPAVSVLY